MSAESVVDVVHTPIARRHGALAAGWPESVPGTTANLGDPYIERAAGRSLGL